MIKPVCTDSILFLPTLSLAETSHFYQKILGLPLICDQGTCQIYRLNETSNVGFCEHIAQILPAESIMLCFVQKDDESVLYQFDYLESQKVQTDGKPRRNEKFGIFHFFAFDPNGYRLEFQSFDDKDWNKVSDLPKN